jgi:hypothetical protein
MGAAGDRDIRAPGERCDQQNQSRQDMLSHSHPPWKMFGLSERHQKLDTMPDVVNMLPRKPSTDPENGGLTPFLASRKWCLELV